MKPQGHLRQDAAANLADVTTPEHTACSLLTATTAQSLQKHYSSSPHVLLLKYELQCWPNHVKYLLQKEANNLTAITREIGTMTWTRRHICVCFCVGTFSSSFVRTCFKMVSTFLEEQLQS